MTDQTSLPDSPLPTPLHPGHQGSWGPCLPFQEWCLMLWSHRNRVGEESSLVEEFGRAGLVYEHSLQVLREPSVGAQPRWGGKGTKQLTCIWWPCAPVFPELASSILLPSAIPPLLLGVSQRLLVSWVWWQWHHPRGPWVTLPSPVLWLGFLLLLRQAYRISVPWTRNLGHTPPAGEVQSLNHWTDREVPVTSFISILVTISEHPLCSKCWLKHHTNMREVPLLVSLLRLRSFSSEKLGAWHKITQPVQSGARASHLSIRFPAWKRMVTPTLSLYDGRAGVRIWVGKDPSLGLWDLSPNPPEWAWEKWFYLENSSFRVTRWKFVRREAM